jgi:predicted metal-dependent hydrolase
MECPVVSCPVNDRKAELAALVERCSGQALDPHYLGYVHCFNRQLFFEAHEVLEQSWLKQRSGHNGMFYKGLIQLAGAFVHLQKNRLRPAVALFNLAEQNLKNYPRVHQSLDVPRLIGVLQQWRGAIEQSDFALNPLTAANRPSIALTNGEAAP